MCRPVESLGLCAYSFCPGLTELHNNHLSETGLLSRIANVSFSEARYLKDTTNKTTLLCETDSSSLMPCHCFVSFNKTVSSSPIRPHCRFMQPCWLWTPSRSSTVGFPTLGKQNIPLLSLSKSNLLLYFLYSNRT